MPGTALCVVVMGVSGCGKSTVGQLMAQALGLPYLYLGYWIEASPKMAYKAKFRPIEILQQGRWIRPAG